MPQPHSETGLALAPDATLAAVEVLDALPTTLVPLSADQQNAVIVYLTDLQSEVSRETMRTRLKQVAALLECTDYLHYNWTGMDFAHVNDLRNVLIKKFSPATVNLTLSAMRGVFAAGWKLGQIDGNRYQRLKSVKSIKGSRLPVGRSLLRDEIARLNTYFENTPANYGVMLRGINAVMLGAGLRREEVCKLPLGSLRDRALYVIGKGNKERRIPLTRHSLNDLESWLALRKNLGIKTAWCFIRVMKNEQTTKNPFSTDGLYNLVASWRPILAAPDAKQVPTLTPHDFRRTFATTLLNKGVDILVVQRLLGHSRTETTAKYDFRADAEAERVMNEIEIY